MTKNNLLSAAFADGPLLPNAAWAWEFLRRNRDYREDFTKEAFQGPERLQLESGSHLIIGERRYRRARKWGLLFFADPDLSALDTEVFWKPSVFPATIPVKLGDPKVELKRRRYDLADMADTVILSALQCRRILFESINGSRHVVINGRRYWIQLYCDTPHPIDDEAVISFRIDGATHARKRIKRAGQLLDLHRSSGRKLSHIGHRRKTDRLQDSLKALDVKRDGGSYRDIARVLFGEKPVAREWANGHSAIKERARRALVRGRQYRDGGYLSLLE